MYCLPCDAAFCATVRWCSRRRQVGRGVDEEDVDRFRTEAFQENGFEACYGVQDCTTR